MQISSSSSVSSTSPSGSGGGDASRIAALQKQLKEATNELKQVATDSTLDTKAKEQKQKLLQAQIQAIQQQIASIQQAAAQEAQKKAQAKADAADVEKPVAPRKPAESRLGNNLDVFA